MNKEMETEEGTKKGIKDVFLELNLLPGRIGAELLFYWLDELLPGNVKSTTTLDLKTKSEGGRTVMI